MKLSSSARYVIGGTDPYMLTAPSEMCDGSPFFNSEFHPPPICAVLRLCISPVFAGATVGCGPHGEDGHPLDVLDRGRGIDGYDTSLRHTLQPR